MYAQPHDALEVIAATDLESLTAAERLQLQAIGAWARTACGDLDGALGAAEASRTQAELLGDEAAWCIAAAAVAIVGIYSGDIAGAVQVAEEVVRRAEGVPTPDTRRMTCYHTLAISLIEADRFEEAAAAINRFRGAAEAVGGTWSVPRLYHASTSRCFLAGEWDDAIAESETLLTMDAAIGSVVVPLVHSKLAIISIHRGELEVAEMHVVKAEQTLATCGRHPRTSWVAWARGRLHEARGLPGLALEALEQSWAETSELGVVAEYARLGPDLVRLTLAEDRPGRAAAVTEATERVAERMGTPSATGAALRCRGLITADPEILLRAVEIVRSATRPLEQGLACEEAAVLLGRAGRMSEARALFDEAVAAYEGLGARYDLDRLAAAMRSLGIRKGKRGTRQRPTRGWDALTETELRVVACAAEGLTNSQIAHRLFISHHTVATHLAHVFDKLGVGSRVELAAQATRRRAAPTT
jgi:DNA-binding CsgD family transcriptional regulator